MYKRQKKAKQPYGYNPNSPLTLHYITTGAILPEKTFQTKKYPRKKLRKSSQTNLCTIHFRKRLI